MKELLLVLTDGASTTDHTRYLKKSNNTLSTILHSFLLRNRTIHRLQTLRKSYLSHYFQFPKYINSTLKGVLLTMLLIVFVLKNTYRNVFDFEFNLLFDYPKRSDTCSTCDSKASNEEHVKNYHAAFDLLKADRENVVYFTIDLQQIILLHTLSSSKAFYLLQMWLYNFSI